MALAPILVLLALMLGLKWSAPKAAPAALLVAVAVALTTYRSSPLLVVLESLKGVWSSLTVVLVIFTALILYELSNQAEAFATIQPAITKIASNELVRILGIGLVLVSFLQGVTGFGVPVAVCAPLLISIGVKPLWAVIIPLTGHAWAGTFGTLALAWNALVVQSGLSGTDAVLTTALFATFFLLIVNVFFGLFICFAYGRWEGVKKGLMPVLILTGLQGGGQILFAQLNPTLACFVPSCFALLGFLAIGKLQKTPWSLPHSPIMQPRQEVAGSQAVPNMHLADTFLPYIILTVLTLLVLLSPLQGTLGQLQFGFAFPETSTGLGYLNSASDRYAPFSPLTHASAFLLLAAIISYAYYRKQGFLAADSARSILAQATKKAVPSSIAVISLMTMARVMGGSGQITVMATFTSAAFANTYGLFTPLIGLLGTFITSSNMSSNVLFAEFQMQTAQLLSLNPAVILAVQTAAGSIGTSISPSNIVLGVTTAGIMGYEGNILKRILPLALLLTALFGVAAWLIA